MIGGLIYRLFKGPGPVGEPLTPSKTPPHGIEKKAKEALGKVSEIQSELLDIECQTTEELAKAEIDYNDRSYALTSALKI